LEFLQKYCNNCCQCTARPQANHEQVPAKMKFLDISFTKDSSLLLHAIHSPFYWWILKKIILLSSFKNPYQKFAKQEASTLFKNRILLNGKLRVENRKNSSLRRLEFMPQLKKLFKNFISVLCMLCYFDSSGINRMPPLPPMRHPK
jgi:hypothetical protein